MMKFDQSLVKAFACPRRGNLLAGKPHGVSGSGPAATGTVVHSLIAAYWRHCQEKEVQTDIAAGHELMGMVDDLEARRIFEVFLNTEVVSDVTCWVERGLESGRWFGTPDLVEFVESGLVAIHDWKTDRRIWSQGEAEDNIQLKLYALLVRDAMMTDEIEPPDAYQLAYHFVRYGEIRDYFFTAEELMYFEQDMERKARAIEQADSDEAKAGPWCGFCEFPLTCPILKGPDAVVIVDGVDAATAAAALYAYRRAEAVLTDSLKAWADDHGEIKGDGWTLGFFSHPRKSYPDGRLIYDLLADYDISPDDVWKIMSPSKAGLKRLVKKVAPELRKELQKKLGAVSKTTQITEFEFKRGEDEEDTNREGVE